MKQLFSCCAQQNVGPESHDFRSAEQAVTQFQKLILHLLLIVFFFFKDKNLTKEKTNTNQ